MCAATVKKLMTHERVSGWVKNHPLHQRSDTQTQDEDLLDRIMENSRLLFAMLILAELEHLTSTLLSNGVSDDSFPEIECSFSGLSHDEQRRLDENRHLIGPVLSKRRHLQLSQETVLPFTRRESIKHGSFGLVFRAEVADGHLEGYGQVGHSKST